MGQEPPPPVLDLGRSWVPVLAHGHTPQTQDTREKPEPELTSGPTTGGRGHLWGLGRADDVYIFLGGGGRNLKYTDKCKEECKEILLGRGT